MFENSLKIVDECGLTYLHVFPFSPRPGTPAARMPQLDKTLIKERAQRLRQKGEQQLDRFLEREIGATRQVLVETEAHGTDRAFRAGEVPQPHGAGRHRHRPGHRARRGPSRGQAGCMSFFKKLFTRTAPRPEQDAPPPAAEEQVQERTGGACRRSRNLNPARSAGRSRAPRRLVRAPQRGPLQILAHDHRLHHLDLHQEEARQGHAAGPRGRADPGRPWPSHGRAHREGGGHRPL